MPTQPPEPTSTPLDEFRSELDFRLAALDRGEYLDGEEAFDRILQKSLAARQSRLQSAGAYSPRKLQKRAKRISSP